MLIRDPSEIEVIAPNFKKRVSGVTSSLLQLVPLQRRMGLGIVALGPCLPKNIAQIHLWKIFSLYQGLRSNRSRIWHARRNIEMVAGVILRDIFRIPLKLVFTAAGERERTRFTHWLISKMDHVVAVTEKCARYIKRPCTIIMHGVDTQRFHPIASAANGSKEKQIEQEKQKFLQQILRKQGLPIESGSHDSLYAIGCFGRIRPLKGTDLFVEAMLQLLPLYPQWYAFIIGRTTKKYENFAKNLHQKIQQAGLSNRIFFLEEQKNIDLYYRHLSLYVSPSLSEGFGLTPLEAMASAVPVVGTRVGAYEAFINQQTGRLLDEPTFTALIKALSPLMKDPAHLAQLGKNARSFVKKNFSLETEARALIRLYHKISEEKIS